MTITYSLNGTKKHRADSRQHVQDGDPDHQRGNEKYRAPMRIHRESMKILIFAIVVDKNVRYKIAWQMLLIRTLKIMSLFSSFRNSINKYVRKIDTRVYRAYMDLPYDFCIKRKIINNFNKSDNTRICPVYLHSCYTSPRRKFGKSNIL